MSKQVIQYAGSPVGIVVPNNGELKFIAVKYEVYDLDEQRFTSALEVLRAIHALMASRETIPRQAA
ncbi:hypothetical protein FHX15_005167 [Rhizobium sp. BK650]|uniref:hypothetical protein n=1 Tax=Rhizobium sp. BK650 TaxID=2586990 RepID=UPI00161910B5|nr:hypothetical protein [Rhizobium sp. BK650]MBB3659898.1 hypothetical protein [Rhizobium sp. BK650]